MRNASYIFAGNRARDKARNNSLSKLDTMLDALTLTQADTVTGRYCYTASLLRIIRQTLAACDLSTWGAIGVVMARSCDNVLAVGLGEEGLGS